LARWKSDLKGGPKDVTSQEACDRRQPLSVRIAVAFGSSPERSRTTLARAWLLFGGRLPQVARPSLELSDDLWMPVLLRPVIPGTSSTVNAWPKVDRGWVRSEGEACPPPSSPNCPNHLVLMDFFYSIFPVVARRDLQPLSSVYWGGLAVYRSSRVLFPIHPPSCAGRAGSAASVPISPTADANKRSRPFRPSNDF